MLTWLLDSDPSMCWGWNCERANGSVRSSFHSTINVLEGLREFEAATGGTPASRAVRAAGEEYLAARNLFRRVSTGEPAHPAMVGKPVTLGHHELLSCRSGVT